MMVPRHRTASVGCMIVLAVAMSLVGPCSGRPAARPAEYLRIKFNDVGDGSVGNGHVVDSVATRRIRSSSDSNSDTLEDSSDSAESDSDSTGEPVSELEAQRLHTEQLMIAAVKVAVADLAAVVPNTRALLNQVNRPSATSIGSLVGYLGVSSAAARPRPQVARIPGPSGGIRLQSQDFNFTVDLIPSDDMSLHSAVPSPGMTASPPAIEFRNLYVRHIPRELPTLMDGSVYIDFTVDALGLVQKVPRRKLQPNQQDSVSMLRTLSQMKALVEKGSIN
ncbi:uncharacterized protein LOC135815252 [Sycon ciliatum]|uniref:uncharacterized protein LOC135815252 n=1 Tax=Sycon ciliatum TaxID=27933 RepID=UPI0031F6996E